MQVLKRDLVPGFLNTLNINITFFTEQRQLPKEASNKKMLVKHELRPLEQYLGCGMLHLDLWHPLGYPNFIT